MFRLRYSLFPCAARQHQVWFVLLVGLLLSTPTLEAVAQRPFQLADPFYRNETARRSFYDKVAFTTEVSYHPEGLGQSGGLTGGSDPLGLRFSVDYELGDNFDVSGIVDAFSSGGGRSLTLSWVVLKYYRYLEEADYALRLAVDPASDRRVGFPQVDVAFLYTSLLSPILSSDFGLGVRRVNMGYFQYVPVDAPENLSGPYVSPRPDILSTRALGTELHAMVNYNMHFDPAGSNVFASILAEGGRYDLVENLLDQELNSGVTRFGDFSSLEADEDASTTEYRGGVVWLRAGAEFNRPSYQVAPYIAAPIKQWYPDENEPVVARLHIGMRFMLR